MNYLVDEKVQGAITIQTTRPVSPDALADVLEAALKANGATLVRSGGLYRILPAAIGERAPRPITVGSARGEAGQSISPN